MGERKNYYRYILGCFDRFFLTGCGCESKGESGSKFMGVAFPTVRFKVGTTTAPDGHYVKGLQEMQKTS